ncbi:MAG: hypothetical protein GWP35_01005 [Proteobacteria bacterium]|nr:hypothetical protein [Pseudomonadota bacterium]
METAVETWVHSLSAKIAERPPQEQSTTCAVSGSISCALSENNGDAHRSARLSILNLTPNLFLLL